MCSIRQANKGEKKEILNLVETVLSDYRLTTNPDETDKDLSDLDSYYFGNKGWFAVIDNQMQFCDENEIVTCDA